MGIFARRGRLLSAGLVAGAGLLAGGLMVGSGVGTPATAQNAPSAPSAGAFTVDPVHTSVVFRVKHMNVAYFWGTFDRAAGSFLIDPANPDKSTIDLTIQAGSVDSNNPDRDKHLLGPDFFSAKEFPTITFKSTKLTKASGGENFFDLAGDLTFRGVTKPVTARLEFTGQGPGREPGSTLQGFEARFTMKRTDFGNTYLVGKGLSDEIDLVVAVEGVRK